MARPRCAGDPYTPVSFALAIATGACFILAAVCLELAPFFTVGHPGPAWDVIAFLARWTLAVGFLSLPVGVLVHIAPATRQPLPWVSFGTTIVTVWWVIVSVGFSGVEAVSLPLSQP